MATPEPTTPDATPVGLGWPVEPLPAPRTATTDGQVESGLGWPAGGGSAV